MSVLYNDPNKWFVVPEQKEHARLRLFCFPFGGGGATFYRSWVKDLPADIELCAVQLPGREGRLREEPFTRLIQLAKTLSEVIETYINMPFAFFGHSMGALICFELARQLRSQNKAQPDHIFISSRRAPHLNEPGPPKHNLPKSKFIEEIRRYNGTPELIMHETELMEIFLPILRADFSILETYLYEKEDSLNCPITVFGGKKDSTVRYEELLGWREHTCGEFKLKMFDGDHFYLKGDKDRLLKAIIDDLKRITKPWERLFMLQIGEKLSIKKFKLAEVSKGETFSFKSGS